jgi:hypothetical protein
LPISGESDRCRAKRRSSSSERKEGVDTPKEVDKREENEEKTLERANSDRKSNKEDMVKKENIWWTTDSVVAREYVRKTRG